MRKMFLFLAMSLIIVSFLLTNPLVSMANVRVEVTSGTGPSSGIPAYARIELGWTLHTDEWAAVPFWRNPDCVPKDFNLLDWFDPNAFECESFVEGFFVWKNGPDDPAPIQVNIKDAGPMHIYFVPWPVMQVAIGDGALTMLELEGLSGVQIGIATFYTEIMHPTGGAQQVMLEIVAKGYMELNNSVQFELKSNWVHDDLAHGEPGHGNAKIEFKTAKAAPALKSQSKLATTWGGMKGKY